MITQVLHCPSCQGMDIVRHGQSPEGKQRCRCRECREGHGRTFLLHYAYAGQSPEVKEHIIEMAMNASGVRDTARVLPISPTTFSTDGWGAYERHIDVEKHQVGKENTQKIASEHLNLRTRITRLVHRTICFSKTEQMHDLVIGFFVNRSEFGLPL